MDLPCCRNRDLYKLPRHHRHISKSKLKKNPSTTKPDVNLNLDLNLKMKSSHCFDKRVCVLACQWYQENKSSAMRKESRETSSTAPPKLPWLVEAYKVLCIHMLTLQTKPSTSCSWFCQADLFWTGLLHLDSCRDCRFIIMHVSVLKAA